MWDWENPSCFCETWCQDQPGRLFENFEREGATMEQKALWEIWMGFCNRIRLQLTGLKLKLCRLSVLKISLDFISWNQWPPSSPDLNPMDFSIWNILKKRVCKKRHKDLKSLELTLKKEWTKIGSGINSKVLWTIHEKNQALCGSKRETFWQKIDLLFFFVVVYLFLKQKL